MGEHYRLGKVEKKNTEILFLVYDWWWEWENAYKGYKSYDNNSISKSCKMKNCLGEQNRRSSEISI